MPSAMAICLFCEWLLCCLGSKYCRVCLCHDVGDAIKANVDVCRGMAVVNIHVLLCCWGKAVDEEQTQKINEIFLWANHLEFAKNIGLHPPPLTFHLICTQHTASTATMQSIERVDPSTLTRQQLLDRKKAIALRLQILDCKPPPPVVPAVLKQTDTHTDYTHKELAWLSADYASERKRQISLAKKISGSVAHRFASLPDRRRKERIDNEKSAKRLAGRMGRFVNKGYWSKIERVVGYKQKLEGERNKRREMDRQLVRMIRETERYGERLRDSSNVGEGGGVTIEEALGDGESDKYVPRGKRKDYTRMTDVKYESLYGQDEGEDDDEEEEYIVSQDSDEEEKGDYAAFMQEIANVSKAEIAEELGLLVEEAELDLQEVLRRLMEESEEISAANGKSLIEVICETNEDSSEQQNVNDDASNASSDVDNAATTAQTNALSLPDEDDHEQVDEFHPANEMVMDDETTIEVEERLGRDMSYADEIAMLQRDNEMSVEELRAMYNNIQQSETNGDSNDTNEVSSENEQDKLTNDNCITPNQPSLLDEDDHEPKDEFHPDEEVDDETTIEAEERLGRDMSYADEIALLQRENEMSIDELRSMYADIEQQQQQQQQHGLDAMDEYPSTDDNDDATVAAANMPSKTKSSLSILNTSMNDADDDEEDFTIEEIDTNMEIDDETTIDAEEKLGRDMTYEQEISQLERENEMSMEELRKMYGLDHQSDDNDEMMSDSAPSKMSREGDESKDEATSKKPKLDDEDEPLTALQALAATDARARETSKCFFSTYSTAMCAINAI